MITSVRLHYKRGTAHLAERFSGLLASTLQVAMLGGTQCKRPRLTSDCGG